MPLPSLLLWFSTLPKLLFCTKEQDQPFLGSLTLVEGKAPRKRVMSQWKHFWSTHSQTQTFTHAQLAHSHPPLLLSCIVLLIRPRRFNVKHNLYLGGKTSLSLPFWVRLCVRPGWCVNGPGKQQGSIGRGLGCLLRVSEQEWRESGMEQGSKLYYEWRKAWERNTDTHRRRRNAPFVLWAVVTTAVVHTVIQLSFYTGCHPTLDFGTRWYWTQNLLVADSGLTVTTLYYLQTHTQVVSHY